jgi:hypothetical protein
MTYTAAPEEPKPTLSEMAEITEMLRCLRVVRQHGGWGEVCVNLKAGDIVEIQTTYTEKPVKPGQKML